MPSSAQSSPTLVSGLRDRSEAPSATNLQALVGRLERMRSLGVEPDRARRIQGAHYALIARVAGLSSLTRPQTFSGTLSLHVPRKFHD